MDFANCTLIGHSSGATTALNLLQSTWFPKVKQVILVGTFLNERLMPSVSWYEPGQFDDLFPATGFDEELIRHKAGKIVCIHGDDDPYCGIGDARTFCDQVGGEFVVVPSGKHLSSNRTELPEILPFIEAE